MSTPWPATLSLVTGIMPVTIRSGRACDFLGDANILEIYDIASLENPIQITQVAMNNPRGLSVDGDLLFVCDGNQGLVIFDVDRANPWCYPAKWVLRPTMLLHKIILP